jgi:hypothetical protein
LPFSEYYLGKTVDALDSEDLRQFVLKEEPESQNLEYKSDGTRLSAHGEAISAFLNSGGGLLIVGAPEEKEKTLDSGRKVRVCRGDLRPLPDIAKDDAHRSLLSKISPIPAGVRVQPVKCDGGCVLVVDVESSSYPPHQHDGSYWIRLDGETRRAPHALIESLFLQRRGPNLECRLEILWSRMPKEPDPSGWRDRWDFRLRLLLINNSRNIAEYCAVDAKTDTTVTPQNDGLHAADAQSGDSTLPAISDSEGRSLLRYRLRGDVLHAFEWKALEGQFRYSRSMDYTGPRNFSMTVELQAKDMLRRRYEFDVPLGMGLTQQTVEPVRTSTITAAP